MSDPSKITSFDIFGFKLSEHSSVKHVIGVVSGKGGVGKSLVCSSLAIALAKEGNKVAILDADVAGPSIPRIFGLGNERAVALSSVLIPCDSAGGISIMSTNLLLENEDKPVIWRAPIVTGVIKQFWEETDWREIDYMMVDMPPGTTDIALTVFQSLPLDGVVIVSSPQDLVQMVVGKAVNMAQDMNVPVVGLVENMAYVECPHCGERIEPYGPSRLAQTAEHYGIEALDQLPTDPALAAACDDGTLEQVADATLLPKALAAIKAMCEGDE